MGQPQASAPPRRREPDPPTTAAATTVLAQVRPSLQSHGGDVDLVRIEDGTAYVQAGAGIVADSRPASEDLETRNKAAAALRAVQVAERMRRLTSR